MPKIKLFNGYANASKLSDDNIQAKIDKWVKENDVTILAAQSSIAAREGTAYFPAITTILYEDNNIKL